MFLSLKDTIFEPLYLACACVACLLAYTSVNHFNTFNRRTRKPPRVTYWLPWIGSAVTMGKDPDGFFERASSKLGPVFNVKAVGQELTYITSPDLISAVYRDVKTFEFTPIRLEMSEKVFGTSHAATYSSHMSEGFFPMHRRALSPQSIAGMLQRYTKYAREHVLKAVRELDGQSSPLVPFLVPAAYYSASNAFFGRSFDAEKSYKPFRKFDDQFHLMLAGVPRFMLPGPHRAWDQVSRMFEQYLEAPHEDCSEFISDVEMGGRNADWPIQDIARIISTELWALQANAVYAAYWVVALALQDPRGLSALVAEIDAARSDWKSENLDQSVDQCQWLTNAPLPLLTSAIQEALRLSTSTFSIRRVCHPVDFAGFHFETGERIVCATRMVHLDEEIHPNPNEFNSERYMRGQNTFTKSGKLVPNHSMPFGGGVSMCEGRHFAMGEVKIYLGMILSHATIELDPDSTSRPTLLMARMGVGLMPPVGDVRVKIRRRDYGT